MHTHVPALLAALALLAPACAPEDEGDVAFRTTLGTGSGSGGGTVFNTNWFHDASLPELRVPLGSSHHGVSIERIELAGGELLQSFEVLDGEIVAVDEDGHPHAGDALVGSTWTIVGDMLPDDEPLVLTSRKTVDGEPVYQFAHGGATLWVNTCKSTGGGEDSSIHARLLAGFTLDEATGAVAPLADTMYIACTNGATGKAAGWGYYDLARAKADWRPLEAALRVTRADYCYDGGSHTQPGVELQIEDRWGVLVQDGPGAVEAVWGEHGLLCRGQGRAAEIPAACGGSVQGIEPCPPGVTIKTYADAWFMTRLVEPTQAK